MARKQPSEEMLQDLYVNLKNRVAKTVDDWHSIAEEFMSEKDMQVMYTAMTMSLAAYAIADFTTAPAEEAGRRFAEQVRGLRKDLRNEAAAKNRPRRSRSRP